MSPPTETVEFEPPGSDSDEDENDNEEESDDEGMPPRFPSTICRCHDLILGNILFYWYTRQGRTK